MCKLPESQAKDMGFSLQQLSLKHWRVVWVLLFFCNVCISHASINYAVAHTIEEVISHKNILFETPSNIRSIQYTILSHGRRKHLKNERHKQGHTDVGGMRGVTPPIIDHHLSVFLGHLAACQ